MEKILLVGTNNLGKLAEFELLFKALGWQTLGVSDIPELKHQTVVETGATFEENALIKARFFAQQSGLLTVADDSGLVVDALDGLPGVFSHRFFEGSDEDRNQELLRRMAGQTNRRARFISVLALVDPQSGLEKTFEGEVELNISESSRGTRGFGYDPVVIPEGQTQTFGELGPAIKNTLSHRYRALVKLKAFLKEQYD